MPFDFDFSPEKLARCISNSRINDWYPVLVDVLPTYGINTKLRIAAWLAQTGHESGDFKAVVENLNYGAQGLMNTWPNRFPTIDVANMYARQPERIANKVYGGRMGNGPEATGEGWKYRGRGLIQVTGKDNYRACSKALYGDEKILLETPQLLQDMDGAVRSACWFWNSRNINLDADRGDVASMTRKINGGLGNLDDRQKRYNRCIAAL